MVRIFIIIGYFITICVAGCLLAYPVFLLTGADFERVVSRTILVLAVLLLYPTCKWLKINSLADLGFVQSRSIQYFSQAWCLGILMLAPISAIYLMCGFRLPESASPALITVLNALVSATVSGILIGLIEESIFRGLLQSQISRYLRTFSTIIIVSIIYSSVHFLQVPEESSSNPVSWYSGFILLSSAIGHLANLTTFMDAWSGLFLAGVFLSLVRLQSDNLVWCMGIHAGWVTHIKLFKEFTDRDNSAACAGYASNYDNYVGELSSLWLVIVLVIWAIVYFLRPGFRH